ncbi:MAG TPA: DUF5996 family protein [Acidimicrobiia bacterium]|jgi:hypothetical protein
MTTDTSQAWPVLTLTEWEDTRDTLHMWTQIVGKIRLALEPMVNHWWQVVLYVSARGLTTSLMHAGDLGLEIEFDFLDDVLVLRTTNGEMRTVELAPRTVADFYRATVESVSALGVDVSIFARPVEIADAIPFLDDVTHHAYDADAARRFWRALLAAHRVMSEFRGRFIGKASPVHFFWGAEDLAVSRFSGRRAPVHGGGVPNCPDWVQELAYSHEVSSCGFWPGGTGEGFFYAYVYPEPAGFSDAAVEPASASYDSELGEFVLSYTDVRTAPDPDALLLSFFQTTYEAAADLGDWPRNELER